MAIRAVSGKPGAGKTLYLVSRVIEPAVKDDRTVYVYGMEGLTLAHEQLRDDFLVPTRSGHYLPDIEQLRQLEPGSVVVFDEAHMVFGAGAGIDMGADIRDWFARHRHYTDPQGRPMEIWVAVQDAMQLTMQFRSLVSEFYHFKRGTLIGVKGMSFMNVWDGPPGDRGAVRTGTRIVFDDKRCFKFYKSTDNATSHLTEAGMFKGGALKAWGGIAFIATVAYMFYSFFPDAPGDDVQELVHQESLRVEPLVQDEGRGEGPGSRRVYLDWAADSYMTLTIKAGVIPEHGRYPWTRNRTLDR